MKFDNLLKSINIIIIIIFFDLIKINTILLNNIILILQILVCIIIENINIIIDNKS